MFKDHPSYHDADDLPIRAEDRMAYERDFEKRTAAAARRLARSKALSNTGDSFDFFLNPAGPNERAMRDAAARSLTVALRR